MTKRITIICGLLLASASSASSIGAEDRLQIDVTPRVAFAPADVTVRTIVAPDAANRVIQIAAESADFYRSSQIQLDGDHAPRTLVVHFRSLPGGTYEVSAILIDARGERTSVRRKVTIRGSAEP